MTFATRSLMAVGALIVGMGSLLGGCNALEDIARELGKDHPASGSGGASGGGSSTGAGGSSTPPGATGPACGPKTCSAGMVCCNASCGICTAPDGACTQQACEPTPSPSPSSCETRTDGGPTSCKSTVTWKQYAIANCEASGLVLSDYKVYEDCGDGNTRNVSYVCCPSTQPPPPTAPGACKTDGDCRLVADYCTGCDCRALGRDEPDPICKTAGVQCLVDPCLNRAASCQSGTCVSVSTVPPTCEKRTQGGLNSTSCKATALWKQYASEDCIAGGMALNEYVVSDPCTGGDFQTVAYVCCTR